MTAFEKSLRTLDGEALRAGAEELLALLAETDGVRTMRAGPRNSGGQKRRGGAAARVSAPITAGAAPEKSGGEARAASAAGAPAPDGANPKTAWARRPYPKTEIADPATAEPARENDVSLPEAAFPEAAAGKDRGKRKRRKIRESREGRNSRKAQGDREDREDPAKRKNREAPESRNDAEKRRDRKEQKDGEERRERTAREEQEPPVQALHIGDGETVDREEAKALEKQLQSLSRQRRGRVQPSGEDGESGAHTAAFQGPERQYEGAVGARGTEMRRISDYFRRDSRRYDTGFTTY